MCSVLTLYCIYTICILLLLKKNNFLLLFHSLCIQQIHCDHMVRTACFNLHITKKKPPSLIYADKRKCIRIFKRDRNLIRLILGSVQAYAKKKQEVAWTRTRQMLCVTRDRPYAHSNADRCIDLLCTHVYMNISLQVYVVGYISHIRKNSMYSHK